MINLNLLPWREEEKAREKKRFLVALAMSACIASALIFRCHGITEKRIADQQAINHALQAEVAVLDHKIAEKQASDKSKAQENVQHKMIQALQAKHAHLLDWFEVFAAVPSTLYFTSIVRSGPHLLIEGKTTSPRAVSTFMQNMGQSPPQLNWIQAQNEASLMGFNITVVAP